MKKIRDIERKKGMDQRTNNQHVHTTSKYTNITTLKIRLYNHIKK